MKWYMNSKYNHLNDENINTKRKNHIKHKILIVNSNLISFQCTRVAFG